VGVCPRPLIGLYLSRILCVNNIYSIIIVSKTNETPRKTPTPISKKRDIMRFVILFHDHITTEYMKISLLITIKKIMFMIKI